jgi:hypothetical protein
LDQPAVESVAGPEKGDKRRTPSAEPAPLAEAAAKNGGEVADQGDDKDPSRPETKTVVIDVDSEAAKKGRSSRRGWWQRLLQ